MSDTQSQLTEEQFKDFFDIFKVVIADPNKRRQLTSLLTDSKPKRWKRTVVAPYYKEFYALQIKSVFDGMMVDRKDREFKYQEFPNLSRNTLYLRINQSILYLLEEMDPEGTYRKFKECIAITREKTGILLSIPEDFRNPQRAFIPVTLEGGYGRQQWKDELDEFLENANPGDVFYKKDLSLSEEDQEELKTSLAQLEDFLHSVTYRTIKVVKMKTE